MRTIKHKRFIFLGLIIIVIVIVIFVIITAINKEPTNWFDVVQKHVSSNYKGVEIVKCIDNGEDAPVYVCKTTDDNITFEIRCFYSEKEILPGVHYEEGIMCVDSIKSFSKAINEYVVST